MEEEDFPCVYSRTQVIDLLKQQRANVQDYIILTYFSINKITDGPLFEKYKRRFNNIIINNFKGVSRNLTLAIFKPKIDEILLQELEAVRYISVIYPNVAKGISPVIIQFFDPKRGLQHRILDFPTGANPNLAPVLTQYQLLNKLVSYCGDYCYKDSAVVNNTSDRVTSLRTLSRNSVLDLPYSESFLDRLFNILLDYLPDDVIKPVMRLGETLMGISGSSQLATSLVTKYKIWLNSSEHILSSDFVDFVISNYDAINSYLYPFKNLPKCLDTLLSSVLQRFILFFMKEVYCKLHEVKLCDNSAVEYYLYVQRISVKFESYRNHHYIPSKAYKFLNDQVNQLRAVKDSSTERHEATIATLFKEITNLVDQTYARAVKYIEPLLGVLYDFHIHLWALLNQGSIPLKFEKVHATFHRLHENVACDSCPTLQEEVKLLNSLFPRLPLLEITSAASRWVLVLSHCQNQIPIVTDLIECLFSWPCSYSVMDDLGGKDDLDCAEKIVRMNMANVDFAEFEKIEEFFDGYMADAQRVVEEEIISVLTE